MAAGIRFRRFEHAWGGVLIRENSEWTTVTFAEKPEREIALKVAVFQWSGGNWSGKTDKLPESVKNLQ